MPSFIICFVVLAFMVPSCVFVCNLFFCSMVFSFNSENKVLIVMVAMISLCVLFWMNYYVGEDLEISKLFYTTLLFVFSMFLFILSDSIFSCLLGWDGLGVTSFLLIIFFNNWDSKFNGGYVMLMNKLGDSLLLFLVCSSVLMNSFIIFPHLVSLGSMLLLLASNTKSARLPFTDWLPLSMAAPTPISALVHSSTLVCAGVILQMKFGHQETSLSSFYLCCLSILYSNIMAFNEPDMKKIVAFSTMSQAAFMGLLLSFNFYVLMFIHLVCHAFFKSSMFMHVGNMIHSCEGNQLKMLNFNQQQQSKSTFIMFLTNNLCLFGFMFLSGFLTKDFFLESLGVTSLNVLVFIMVCLSLFSTIIYAINLVLSSMEVTLKSMKTNLYSVYANVSGIILTSLGAMVGVWSISVLHPSFSFIVPYKFLLLMMSFGFIVMNVETNPLFTWKSMICNFHGVGSFFPNKMLTFSLLYLDSGLEFLSKFFFKSSKNCIQIFFSLFSFNTYKIWSMLFLVVVLFITF